MKIKKIESSANALYKKLLSLTKSKGVREEQLCLVSGERIIAEQMALQPPKDAFWVFHSDSHPLFAMQPDLQCVVLPKDLFSTLDVVGSEKPLACLPTPEIQKWKHEAMPQSHELLCALGDPNNLGALLRSAKAFGIQNVILLEESCHPFHPKAIKAASGACFGLNYFKGPSIKHLGDVQRLLAMDLAAPSVRTADFSQPWRILLGEEGQGVPSSLRCQKVSIPYPGDIESLNATIAASILFYEMSRASTPS